MARDDSKVDRRQERADHLFSALNHPLRRRILEALARERASASSLSGVLGVDIGSVSYHLIKVLYEECQLVRIVARYQRRGALEKVFALRREALVDAIEWQLLPASLRADLHGVGLEGFFRAAVDSLSAEARIAEPTGIYTWRSLAVDADGQREIDEAVHRLERAVDAIEDRCAAMAPELLRQRVVGVAAFDPVPSTVEVGG